MNSVTGKQVPAVDAPTSSTALTRIGMQQPAWLAQAGVGAPGCFAHASLRRLKPAPPSFLLSLFSDATELLHFAGQISHRRCASIQ